MAVKIAINGFGRIGRLVLRALFENGRNDINVVAINDLAEINANAHLFRYDSVHGYFPRDVSVEGNDILNIAGKDIKVTKAYDPAELPWSEMGIDVVLECTGVFTKRSDAAKHIQAGARKVLISAPAKDEDITVVYGVNDNKMTADHEIVSNASCTTNCLAPVAYVLDKAVGIKSGFMTTIHSYTSDQKLVDNNHKDLYRARAAATNIIPTSTGAAKAVGKVLPHLNGKLDGVAMRVPTPNVSLVDFKFQAMRATTCDEINNAIREASVGELKNILATYSEPLVSSDFNHNPFSSVFSVEGTNVIDDTFVRVMAWYDNEWGFSNRMLDTAAKLGSL